MKRKAYFFMICMMTVWVLHVPAEEQVPDEIVFDAKLDSMKKAGVGAVVYPHKAHAAIYECGDCHPAIFDRKIGSSDINMQKNIDGKYCGFSGCHNSARAFPLYLCENCHMPIVSE